MQNKINSNENIKTFHSKIQQEKETYIRTQNLKKMHQK